jgi:Predicted membrane protein
MYLLFGLLTTAVDYAVYLFCAARLHGEWKTALATSAAWLSAVLFAYFTNRAWVFPTAAHSARSIAKEAGAFFGARVFSGVCSVLAMVFLADFLLWNDRLAKILVTGFVVILNYLLSKFLVFRPK